MKLPRSFLSAFCVLLASAFSTLAGDSIIVFNEVHYHPAPGQAEFIELRNLNGVDVAVGGWKIEGGVDYTFPANHTIPGGGFVIIGAVPGALGAFTGQLDNAGDTLRLRNLNGRLMDELEYEAEGDWPQAADGSGATLSRREASAASGPGAWAASLTTGGTPGSANFAAPGAPISTLAFPLTSAWKYDNSGGNPVGWTTTGYDDSAWPSSNAPFYFGNPSPSASPPSAVTSVGVWSIERWTGDADSQVSTSKTYTHKVDFGHTATQTVLNGVTFDNTPGQTRTGSNWTLTGATQTFTTNTAGQRNTMTNPSGSYQLLTEFFYGSSNSTTEVLELTGLTPDQYYTLTFYCTGWDTREARRMRTTPSNTGIPTVIDQGAWSMGKGLLVKYQYRAPSNGRLSVELAPLLEASWHQYAFTNEVTTALPVEAKWAGDVTVQGQSSQFTNRSAAFTVDGSGLDPMGNHVTTGDGFMWQTNGTAANPMDPLPADITWTLATPATLTGLRIWNFNELLNPTGVVTDNTTRGVKDVEIFVSPDATGETFTSAGTFVVPQAFGCTAEIGSRIAFPTAQPNVRRVRLNAATNWAGASGFAGLAEVQFLTPGTLLPSNPTTTRFRKQFNAVGFANSTYTVTLQHGVDDGAVFYLNGSEIHRTNITGSVTPSTPADNNLNPPVLTTVNLPGTGLTLGSNILAVELHQASSGLSDAWFSTSLTTNETVQPPSAGLRFNEIANASAGASFFIEIHNPSASGISTAGYSILTSSGQSFALPVQTIAGGGLIVIDAVTLGFVPANGSKIFLLSSNGTNVRDGRDVSNRLRGFTADGNWGFPTSATPGSANVAVVSDAIVINEIFYHGLDTSAEQWIELFNKSAAPVNVSQWRISNAISYQFSAGTPPIPPGGFVVVAWDPTAFNTLHGFTPFGPVTSSLIGKGETIVLLDANGNVADSVSYSDGGRWSQWADGGGSSLELRDPHADNSTGEAWDASDESGQSTWQTVTAASYQGLASNPNSPDPTTYNEFVFGLLNSGEMLIDDLSVKNVTLGNVELLQNGAFDGGTAAFWRIIGSHAGTVVDDPTQPGNKVLKISANAATEHMHNHAETTLKQGVSFHTINPGQTYSISFRAKWLRGSNRLHTRLWHNRLARQTLLNRPLTGGTPGAPNSRLVPNIGPTFDALAHTPVIPPVSQPATVTIKVEDPDGVAEVRLFTSINGAAFTSAPMTTAGSGIYTGAVTGQAANTLVQFYVRATDTPGAVSFFPAAGPASRAMIPWQDGRALLTLPSGARPHNVRIVLPTVDATELYKLENLMSDGAVPCTVILDEQKVYYRAAVRLKSSEHGRISAQRCGFTLEFPGDDLFYGQHDTVSIDRSGGTSAGQKEILLKRLSNLAGGIYASEDDIIRVISPIGSTLGGNTFTFTGATMTSPAILSKSRLDKEFLDDQFTNGGDGPMFKYERVYVLTETMNPTTRNKDGTIVPENPKVPQDSTSPPGVGVNSLGANKESYRWYWLLQNARDPDDYSGMINVANAVGQAGGSGAFNSLTNQFINVNSWLRATVPSTLFGVVDNYLGSGGGQHNALIYFPPGQKAILIPWDLDFLSQSDPNTSLTGGGDLSKFLANPVYKRQFYGHLLDILNRSFNTSTMTTWATHYTKFSSDDMTGSLSYLTQRAAVARNAINTAIPPVNFARASPSPVTVATPFATVSGVAWVDVAGIRLQGATKPLAVTWTGATDTSWSLQLPLSPGMNTYTLIAFDTFGTQVGSATVTVNATGTIFPAGPGNLVVSELHYNPSGSLDTTEFIELQNITATTLDLTGCHFDEELGQGIAYSFANGVQVPAGGRIIVARDRPAFVAAYPSASPVAGGGFDPSALDNNGESIVLYAASGLEIFRFTYDDTVVSTDGNGRSLVRVISSTNPNPNTYAWRASLANAGNPGGTDAIAFTGSPLADIDFDSFPRIVEYAFGTNDNDPASRPPAPIVSFSAGNTVSASIAPLPNADDIIATIETKADLNGTWTDYTGPVPAGATQFFRVKVSLR
jgi:hypothetical protein